MDGLCGVDDDGWGMGDGGGGLLWLGLVGGELGV